MDIVRDSAIRELHARGLTDSQISKQLGISVYIVHRRRRCLGLPRLPQFDEGLLRDLCQKGLNDRQIAARMGCSTTCVRKHRLRLGIPSNVRRDPARRASRLERLKLADCGVPMESALTPEQCALMQRFFRDLLFCANHCPPGDSFNLGRFLRLWRKNFTDAESSSA